ncbi:hypothetical protein V8C37DRAFT_48323 [Trichoderma ceciliae]
MAPQDKKWDDSAERDLCVAIILGNQELAKGRHNWPRISEIMNSLGYSFSKDAMSQHFTKTIMREFRARHTTAGATDSPPLSARKSKAAGKATTPSKKRTKKSTLEASGAKGLLTDIGDEEDDDFEFNSTPSKRVKKEDKGMALKREEMPTQGIAADNEEAFHAWSAQRSSTTESHPFH